MSVSVSIECERECKHECEHECERKCERKCEHERERKLVHVISNQVYVFFIIHYTIIHILVYVCILKKMSKLQTGRWKC